MIYREYLVMRKAFAWYAVVAIAVMVSSFLMMRGPHAAIDFGSITVQSGAFAAIFAWITGVALGNGSREAARVLWVLPIERWKGALQVIAIDLAAVTAAFAFEYALMLVSSAIAGMRFGAHASDTPNAAAVALGLTLAYATYGWSALVGMLGRRVPYFAFIAAPVLILWMMLAEVTGPVGAVLRAVIVVNPIAVFNTALAVGEWQHHHAALDTISTSLLWLGTTWEVPVLFAIAAATCALTVLRWQQAQAIS